MHRLIVLGNGFDLAHGLPSGYWSFKKHLERENTALHRTLDSLGDGDLWSDFESNLARLKLFDYAESLCERRISPGKSFFNDKHDIAVAKGIASIMRRVVEQVTDELQQELLKWIGEVDNCEASAVLRCIHSHESILSFNYTTTVERLYAVPAYNVCHIHGRIGSADLDYKAVWSRLCSKYHPLYEGPHLMFGHGMREVDAVIPVVPFPCQTVDYDLNHAHEVLRASFEEVYASYERSRKKIEDSLPILRKFLESQGPFSSVFIIGHSLSSVDVPYFEAIADHVGVEADYTITYFSEGAKEEIIKRAQIFARGAQVRYVDAGWELFSLE